MMDDKTGGTVFPTTEANWHNENVRSEGMTLRDYFAAKAMQAYLSWDNADTWLPGDLADDAYLMADAMIAARTK